MKPFTFLVGTSFYEGSGVLWIGMEKKHSRETAVFKLAPIVVVMPFAVLAFEALARHLNGKRE